MYGKSSVYEWLHRASLIPAYVRRTDRAELVRSDLSLTLDRSESAAVSYALGQAMTAIFCRTQLGVSHLLHIDRYSAQHDVLFGVGRRRADLFGVSPRGWVVAEAKGRSGHVRPETRRALEDQKRSIVAIEGKRPWVALGCVAHFPQRVGPMHLEAFDPEDDADEAIALDVTRDRFMLAYYAPFLRALEVGVSRQDDNFQSADFAGLGIRIGLSIPLVARLRRAESGALAGLSTDVEGLLAEVLSLQGGVLPDGSLVETDWQESIDRWDSGRFEG
ncbi:hypothetical protein [Saccharothrix carnea]|uniref:hypothetical protein n=1 Tax=Saccharothrix carnea TaxID=1280637 RepID=UPI0011B1E2A1|nr:hypothetical protein [Saccharothrix carnea]